MSHRSGPGADHGIERGTHLDFVVLYDLFLDTVYPDDPEEPEGAGRQRLTRGIADAIRERGGSTLLDCAAGTGFPALGLAVEHGDAIDVHCTDGDPAMIDLLAGKAANVDLSAEQVAPPRHDTPGPHHPPDALVLDWDQLDLIDRQYDYVMCRGNSLAYADTWTGLDEVVGPARLEDYLQKMADRVRPGGHLHIDAPWRLDLATRTYPGTGPVAQIWEEVSHDTDHRQWRVGFELSAGPTIEFFRRSSLLTIQEVEAALEGLGFCDVAPQHLAGERAGFGVIIARKPG